MKRATRRAWALTAAITILTVIVANADRLDPVPPGLAASYFPSLDSSTSSTVTQVEPVPSTDRITAAWNGAAPDTFTATWRGTIFIPDDGPVTLATRSDGESSVYLDGRLVVENAATSPGRGSHSLALSYLHRGGAVHFELLWAGERGVLSPVPEWVLRPQHVATARILFTRWQRPALAAMEWTAVASYVLAVALTLSLGLFVLIPYLRREEALPELAWILAASAVLNVIGIEWGMYSWSTIEVAPPDVIYGLADRFSRGWFSAYPPFQYELMAAATSPLLILDRLGRINVNDWLVFMLLVHRAASLIMAAGVLIAVYLAGRLTFGRRAGLFGAAIFALVAPFVYYAKLANVDVPYLFWFSLSVVFYLRLLEGGRTRDFVCFAGAATLAICTKDQAYGLYAFTPLVVIWEQRRTRGSSTRAWLDAVFNRQIGAAILVAVILFLIADNVIVNFDGFVKHVQMIIGPGSVGYRNFEPTLAGRWSLLRLTFDLTQQAWGWPFFLTSLAGLGVAATDAHGRRRIVWLLAPVVGYYLTFINVILYNYDRFMLPVCLVLALFGGLALDRFTQPGKARTWRLTVVGTAFVYGVLYSGLVDVLMLRDSRYAVERWFAGRLGPDDVIGQNMLPDFLPRLPRLESVPTIDYLRFVKPRYFVLNVDYLRAVPRNTPEGQLIDGLERHELGYRLVYSARTPSPWPWLPGGHPDLVGPRLEPRVSTMLRNLNPTIEVFEREPSAR